MKFSMMLWMAIASFTLTCFADEKPVFPQACQENCITPFGSKLGVTSEGTEAYLWNKSKHYIWSC